ncbi:MAG TPA: PEP-CTERM sorting domain-containing protein [Cellvibrio sp.]|nr:PEP-CTERM sorting domain-containing protein [Cellvibrio sp.]
MCSHSLLSTSIRKAIAFLLFLCTVFSIGNTQAVTIDFDDLNPADYVGSGWYFPVTNEYEYLGVLFSGYVNPVAISTQSAPNILYGSIGMSIYFIDTLPTYVSMYVGSTFNYKVGIRAHGANEYFEDRLTDGAVRGMNQESSTPYRPNQFISFYIPEGISSIHLGGQADAYIDDLTFIVDVPEPGMLILFCIGILGFISRRQKATQIC